MRESVEYLLNNAGPIIKYRTLNEFLHEDNYIIFREAILNHKYVKEIKSWQCSDGYLGVAFHGGWLPANRRIQSSKSMEVALRFLGETGLKIEEPFIDKALKALQLKNYNRSFSNWDIFKPEFGLYGSAHERGMLMARFGIEDPLMLNESIEVALERFKFLATVDTIESCTMNRKGTLYTEKGKGVPDLYHLRLLAYSNCWRNEANLKVVIAGLNRYIELSPWNTIYALYNHQKIAPAMMSKLDFHKDLSDYDDLEWYRFLSVMELFSRLNVIDSIPRLSVLADQLEEKMKKIKEF